MATTSLTPGHTSADNVLTPYGSAPSSVARRYRDTRGIGGTARVGARASGASDLPLLSFGSPGDSCGAVRGLFFNDSLLVTFQAGQVLYVQLRLLRP
jgi:hypothetical protein